MTLPLHTIYVVSLYSIKDNPKITKNQIRKRRAGSLFTDIKENYLRAHGGGNRGNIVAHIDSALDHGFNQKYGEDSSIGSIIHGVLDLFETIHDAEKGGITAEEMTGGKVPYFYDVARKIAQEYAGFKIGHRPPDNVIGDYLLKGRIDNWSLEQNPLVSEQFFELKGDITGLLIRDIKYVEKIKEHLNNYFSVPGKYNSPEDIMKIIIKRFGLGGLEKETAETEWIKHITDLNVQFVKYVEQMNKDCLNVMRRLYKQL